MIADLTEQFSDDFPAYSACCLTIRTKSGGLEPFRLNRVQLYIHERLERQRRQAGKVRALILKGRQQGCSTYVGGRFYWRVTYWPGARVFILTHEQPATDNLFGMASRFHENCPEEFRPVTGAANAKELFFPILDSGYQVGTAGTKGVGRSQTIQLFHGSEVGFWPHADTHATGVVQAIPDAPDTEVVLESTANGIGNYFHSQWQRAERGESDYQAIFIPWFWSEEYSRPVGTEFCLDDEEADYAAAHGLSNEQMAWRRAKIIELDGLWKFRQEYPATASEAFQTSGEESFIQPEYVLAARKCELKDDVYAPRIGGCDPARFGNDATAFCVRQGRKVIALRTMRQRDTMEVAGHCIALVREFNLTKLFLDVGGLGAGIYDRLKELGHSHIVVAVNGANSPLKAERYLNKRAEMWGEMRDAIKAQPFDLPDDDLLHGQLVGPRYTYDSASRIKLERKEDMMKRGLSSPDEADALALTFAMPVGPSIGPGESDELARDRDSVTGY